RTKVHRTWRHEREKYLVALDRARSEAVKFTFASLERLQVARDTRALVPAVFDAPAGAEPAVPLVALSFVRTLPAEPYQMPELTGPLHHPPARNAMQLTGQPILPVALNFSRSGPVASGDES
ncbi:MAG: hypothetical protein ACREE7_08520, partial [Dongiaceae bacterium]